MFFRKLAICWPVASFTILARSRLRKARFRRTSLKPVLFGGRLRRQVLSGSTMRVSIRIARLNLLAGTVSPGLFASLKS